MVKKRKRLCKDCNKPLGSTIVRCYECGGQQPTRQRADGRSWKLTLGCSLEQIIEAEEEYGDVLPQEEPTV